MQLRLLRSLYYFESKLYRFGRPVVPGANPPSEDGGEIAVEGGLPSVVVPWYALPVDGLDAAPPTPTPTEAPW